MEFEIKVAPDQQPIRRRPFQISEAARQESQKQIQEMLEAGIIEESQGSPWGFPLIVVAKKSVDGAPPEWRCVIDFRALNQVSRETSWPIPTHSQIFSCLAERRPKFMSLLDLRAGYWQIPVKEEPSPGQTWSTKEMLTFVTPTSSYSYKVMPFGTSSAPTMFQLLISKCFGNYLFERVLAFIDDILVFSPSWEMHLVHLDSVFQRLRAARLMLHCRKSEIGLESLTYLGHTISVDGVSPSKDQIDKVQTWPRPTNVKQLKSFLGFASFYRRYVKDFSKITAEFGDLLRKDVAWRWTEKHEEAFEKLKLALCTSVKLPHAYFSKPFRISTDASQKSIAYVLSQPDETGFYRPILYGGRCLREAETRYGATELELFYSIVHHV